MLWVDEEMHEREAPATEERPGWDRFGFLPSGTSCHFLGGSIEPVANFADVKRWVQQTVYCPNLLANPNEGFEPGILFPPNSWRQRRQPGTENIVGNLAGSYAPALIHRVPVSHYLKLDPPHDTLAERGAATGFLIRLFGFVDDSPAQFWDWWFDGAMSIGGMDLLIAPVVLEDFASHSFDAWRSWPLEAQQLMVALLKMHAHAPGYRWPWERFSWEYTVTDCCNRVAEIVWPARFPRGGRHAERINRMAREFGLRFSTPEEDWVKSIVDLRNDLLHAARWAGGVTSGPATLASHHSPRELHKLNQRLIVGLIGYRNDFLTSGWLTLTQAPFSKMS